MIAGMQPVRVAVIGAGFMGERHARIYAGLPDVELVAVCDVREARGARAGRAGRAPSAYSDLAALFRPGRSRRRRACARRTASTGSRASWRSARGRHVLAGEAHRDHGGRRRGDRRGGGPRGRRRCWWGTASGSTRATTRRGRRSSAASWARSRRSTRAGPTPWRPRTGSGGDARCPLFLGVHDYDVMRWLAGERGGAGARRSPSGGSCESRGSPVEDANCALLRFASGVLGIAELNWILPRGFPAGGRPPARRRGERGIAVDRDSRDGAPAGGRPARGPGGHGVRPRRCRGIPGACSTSSCATSSTACAGAASPAVTPGDAVHGPPDRARRRASGRRRDRRSLPDGSARSAGQRRFSPEEPRRRARQELGADGTGR